MRKCILLIVFTILCLHTTVYGHNFIHNGDTAYIKMNPLKQRTDFEEINKIIENEFGDLIEFAFDKCTDDYEVNITMDSNKNLYITDIYVCSYSSKIPKEKHINLDSLFKEECQNGRVPLSWFSDTLNLLRGKRHVIDMCHLIFDKEQDLYVKDGKVVGEQSYENYFHKPTIFNPPTRIDEIEMFDYIGNHINWSIVPNLENKKFRVPITITGGESPTSFKVEIIKSCGNELLDQEAVRVIKTLPDWFCIREHGKYIPIKYSIPVIFNEERRKKYAK